MEFTYSANLDDLVSVHTRVYFQSRGYRKSRWISAGFGACLTGGLTWLIARGASYAQVAPFSAAAGVLMGIWFYISYPRNARKRIRKIVAQEYSNRYPAETTYRLAAGRISVESLGTEVRYDIENLTEIFEDDSHVYLDFGALNSCIIPKEAVETETLAGFLSELRKLTGDNPTQP